MDPWSYRRRTKPDSIDDTLRRDSYQACIILAKEQTLCSLKGNVDRIQLAPRKIKLVIELIVSMDVSMPSYAHINNSQRANDVVAAVHWRDRAESR